MRIDAMPTNLGRRSNKVRENPMVFENFDYDYDYDYDNDNDNDNNVEPFVDGLV
jgi:hypothetical protein